MPKEQNQVDLLYEIAQVFSASLEMNETLESVLKLLDKHLHLTRGTVTILDPDTETINITIAHGLSEKEKQLGHYKVGEGITGKVVQTGKAEIVPDINKDPRFLNRTGSRSNLKGKKLSFICVPIILERQTIGALSVDTEYKDASFIDECLRVLKIITPFIAQSVKMNRLMTEKRKDIQKENQRLKMELKEKFKVENMVGDSNAMQDVYRLIEQVADSNTTVLIRGESGTGKELVAHAVHYNSYRASKPFIKVNCTALPETLLESELFGHEKGAFTGAVKTTPGKIEQAQGGTLFLDEIGDVPLALQVKLLRFLQER
ncbi:MAG: sigma 54-interacting transcriptional regulator, partial [Candidatus Margulisiibacteriota bacterium]